MTFPVTQAELIAALKAINLDHRYVQDVQLLVEHGGRLFLQITCVATDGNKMLVGTDGDPWKTQHYVPLERLRDEAQH